MPPTDAGFATFETRIWWSPGSAAKNIAKLLAERGLKPVAMPQKFVVTGRYGPLKDGEIERARQWAHGSRVILTKSTQDSLTTRGPRSTICLAGT